MKLSDWADKQGISYLTAYRWWRAGTLPVKAFQTDSGTIIVEDDSEQSMTNNSNDAISTFLKKTVEYCTGNKKIEDFAAYVLSNFQLKLNQVTDSPKYSRNKPKPEDIQKHFKQFIPAQGEKPKPNMFVTESLDEIIADSKENIDNTKEITSELLISEVAKIGNLTKPFNTSTLIAVTNIQDELYGKLSSSLNPAIRVNSAIIDPVAEGAVNYSVTSTPQNCTGSTDSALRNFSYEDTTLKCSSISGASAAFEFNPNETAVSEVKSILQQPAKYKKRGRKSSKIIGKK